MECGQKTNKSKCKCTYEPCPRKGLCCECIGYHLSSNELPGCCFTPSVEKEYDRSVERFVKMVEEK